MHTVCKAIYVACETRDGDMAYLVMKTSPSHHLCHQGKKPVTSRHDQTLMQLSWMLKYYDEQRPSSCRTSTFKCVVPSSCRTSKFKCVVPSSCRTSTFKCVCPFKLQNLHFQMCLCLQVAEHPPSNVFVPSSCRTPTFKCVCAFKLQNLHLQTFCAFKLQNLHLQMCCAFKLQNLHLQMCCAFKLQNLHLQMCLRLQVAEHPPSNVFVPYISRELQ